MAKLAKRGSGHKVRRAASRVGSLARRAGGALVRRARAHGQRPKLSHVAEAGVAVATGAGLAALAAKQPALTSKLAVGPLNPALTLGLVAAVLGTMVKPVAHGKAGAAVRAAANASLAVGAAQLAAEKMGAIVAGEDDGEVGFEDDSE